MATEILHTFTNESTGMATLVTKHSKGFAVALKDLDSGEMFNAVSIYPTIERAIAKAKEVQVGV